jgi:hypothetical protein
MLIEFTKKKNFYDELEYKLYNNKKNQTIIYNFIPIKILQKNFILTSSKDLEGYLLDYKNNINVKLYIKNNENKDKDKDEDEDIEIIDLCLNNVISFEKNICYDENIVDGNNCFIDPICNLLLIQFNSSKLNYIEIDNNLNYNDDLRYNSEKVKLNYCWNNENLEQITYNKITDISNVWENKYVNLPSIPYIIDTIDINSDNSLIPNTGSAVYEHNKFIGMVSYVNTYEIVITPLICIKKLSKYLYGDNLLFLGLDLCPIKLDFKLGLNKLEYENGLLIFNNFYDNILTKKNNLLKKVKKIYKNNEENYDELNNKYLKESDNKDQKELNNKYLEESDNKDQKELNNKYLEESDNKDQKELNNKYLEESDIEINNKYLEDYKKLKNNNFLLDIFKKKDCKKKRLDELDELDEIELLEQEKINNELLKLNKNLDIIINTSDNDRYLKKGNIICSIDDFKINNNGELIIDNNENNFKTIPFKSYIWLFKSSIYNNLNIKVILRSNYKFDLSKILNNKIFMINDSHIKKQIILNDTNIILNKQYNSISTIGFSELKYITYNKIKLIEINEKIIEILKKIVIINPSKYSNVFEKIFNRRYTHQYKKILLILNFKNNKPIIKIISNNINNFDDLLNKYRTKKELKNFLIANS